MNIYYLSRVKITDTIEFIGYFNSKFIIYRRSKMSANTDFNKNLTTFLTESRETALRELYQNNLKYKDLREKISNLSKEAEGGIPTEYSDIMEKLIDSYLAVSRMEANYLYLRGFKDCVKLYKRLDDTFDESDEFEQVFV